MTGGGVFRCGVGVDGGVLVNLTSIFCKIDALPKKTPTCQSVVKAEMYLCEMCVENKCSVPRATRSSFLTFFNEPWRGGLQQQYLQTWSLLAHPPHLLPPWLWPPCTSALIYSSMTGYINDLDPQNSPK